MIYRMMYNDFDQLTLAKTLYGECRGEPTDGQVAVAWVIRNRASRPRFVGQMVDKEGAISRACLAPWQFSCWNANDLNRKLLDALTRDRMPGQLSVSTMVLDGKVDDPTNGGDHYHTIAKPEWAEVWPPAWVGEMKECARFGGHVFYDSGSR